MQLKELIYLNILHMDNHLSAKKKRKGTSFKVTVGRKKQNKHQEST